jgi:hypothetical protein
MDVLAIQANPQAKRTLLPSGMPLWMPDKYRRADNTKPIAAISSNDKEADILIMIPSLLLLNV